jgi:hypothetical protein
MHRAAGILLALVLGRPLASAAETGSAIQYGIRLDSRSSIQWSGSTIFASSDRVGVTRATGGNIYDVWEGPSRGMFAVYCERGLGLLLGRDVEVLASVQPSGSILRSPRHDSVFIGFTDRENGREVARIREWRRDGQGRDLVSTAGHLLDFDVSSDRVIAILTVGPSLTLAGLGNLLRPMALPQPPPASPVRIFVARDAAELDLLYPKSLCSLSVADAAWRCTPFDSTTQAVVRDVSTGRAAAEPKLSTDTRRNP